MLEQHKTFTNKKFIFRIYTTLAGKPYSIIIGGKLDNMKY